MEIHITDCNPSGCVKISPYYHRLLEEIIDRCAKENCFFTKSSITEAALEIFSWKCSNVLRKTKEPRNQRRYEWIKDPRHPSFKLNGVFKEKVLKSSSFS